MMYDPITPSGADLAALDLIGLTQTQRAADEAVDIERR
jgi:hypothetical protein